MSVGQYQYRSRQGKLTAQCKLWPALLHPLLAEKMQWLAVKDGLLQKPCKTMSMCHCHALLHLRLKSCLKFADLAKSNMLVAVPCLLASPETQMPLMPRLAVQGLLLSTKIAVLPSAGIHRNPVAVLSSSGNFSPGLVKPDAQPFLVSYHQGIVFVICICVCALDSVEICHSFCDVLACWTKNSGISLIMFSCRQIHWTCTWHWRKLQTG